MVWLIDLLWWQAGGLVSMEPEITIVTQISCLSRITLQRGQSNVRRQWLCINHDIRWFGKIGVNQCQERNNDYHKFYNHFLRNIKNSRIITVSACESTKH